MSGSRVVYERFAQYQPRSEPADYTAGGKIPHFRRIEWVVIPDPATAARTGLALAGCAVLPEAPHILQLSGGRVIHAFGDATFGDHALPVPDTEPAFGQRVSKSGSCETMPGSLRPRL